MCQDIFLNDAARKYADVVLPASSFAEKDGTFTNTERRVSRVRQAPFRSPATRARISPSWTSSPARSEPSGPSTQGAEDVWNEFADLAPNWSGSGTTGSRRSGSSGRASTANDPGTPYLYAREPARPSGKGKFYPVEYQPPIEEPDSEYPVRPLDRPHALPLQLGGMTMREEGVTDKQEDPFIEMSPEDADALGVEDGDWVRLRLRRGEVEAKAVDRRPRRPGPRLDGAPLQGGARQPAHERRRWTR